MPSVDWWPLLPEGKSKRLAFGALSTLRAVPLGPHGVLLRAAAGSPVPVTSLTTLPHDFSLLCLQLLQPTIASGLRGLCWLSRLAMACGFAGG